MHGGPNQQWEFIPSGHGYVIRSVRRSKEGHPLYLTTDGGVHEHAAVVASPYPVSWNVEQTEDGIRISWPNTNLVFDLADWGSKTPGTKIQLMHLKPGEPCQLWHYTRCAPAAEHDNELEVRSARAVSPPATTADRLRHRGKRLYHDHAHDHYHDHHDHDGDHEDAPLDAPARASEVSQQAQHWLPVSLSAMLVFARKACGRIHVGR
ncbi:hypothetical protein NUW54_g10542 [Trametes sanguinea]|uniref:Uncharacterized protein n=1 Tax=Trametes sanguinea TaxID=158606 RepID=A0ACC1NYA7_9APHY|nr:hypothetical protein NUW54_g10542 [Trametes sanguinea]